MKQNDLNILLETCLDGIPNEYLQIILEAEAMEAEDPEKWANLAKSFTPTAKNKYSELKTMIAFLKKNAHMDTSQIEEILADGIPNTDRYQEIKTKINELASKNPKVQEVIANWDKFWPAFQTATGKKNIMLPKQKRAVPEDKKGMLSRAVDKVKGVFKAKESQNPQLPLPQHRHIEKFVDENGDDFRNFFKKSLISNNYRDAAKQLKAHMDKDGISHNLDDMVKAMQLWNSNDLTKGVSWFFANYNLNPMPLISSYAKSKSGQEKQEKTDKSQPAPADKDVRTRGKDHVTLRSIPKDWLDTNIKRLLDGFIKKIDPSVKIESVGLYTFILNSLILTEADESQQVEQSNEVEYKYVVHGKELVISFRPTLVSATYDGVLLIPEYWDNIFKAPGSTSEERKKAASEHFASTIKSKTEALLNKVAKKLSATPPVDTVDTKENVPSLEPEKESEAQESVPEQKLGPDTETDIVRPASAMQQLKMPSEEELKEYDPKAIKAIEMQISNLEKLASEQPENKEIPIALEHFKKLRALIDTTKTQDVKKKSRKRNRPVVQKKTK